MVNKLKSVIGSAIVRLLRPLVMILLRNGIPYGTFVELAKWVYVDVALQEFDIPGRKQSISRVSVITGLSRKEVKRIKEIAGPDDLSVTERYNRAARVISGWLKDPHFLDDKGEPRVVPFEKEEVSFSSLVKAYSGDIPPRAMLDEMLRVGVVGLDNGRIRLLTRGYVVRKGEVEKLSILGVDVGELISTINHNLVNGPSDLFLQRKVSYDNIPEDALLELRRLVSKKGEDFIESVDKLMSKYDRDVNPSVKGEGQKKAGLGIFYFE
ncbi:MAG: DUF6502 family protein [Thermodesulfobacteriota bacterium]